MFDPRLTEVYQVAGEPYTYQDASGELAAMAVGASLWGLANQILENGDNIRVKRALGTRWNYFAWELESPIFPLVGAAGLAVKDWHDLILVNQVGERFYDETQGDYPEGNKHKDIDPYTPGDHRNTHIEYDPHHSNFFNAAVAMNAGSKAPDYSGGPVWAIFDSDAVEREGWKVTPPYVDPDGYFFTADTLAELAAAIENPWQAVPMSGAALETAVRRYNSFVDSGTDEDFGKPSPKYKIQTPPFHAAWGTPLIHDSRAGLRIDEKCQVLDMDGQVIPGLYCGGESAGRVQPARHGTLHRAGLHRREGGGRRSGDAACRCLEPTPAEARAQAIFTAQVPSCLVPCDRIWLQSRPNYESCWTEQPGIPEGCASTNLKTAQTMRLDF